MKAFPHVITSLLLLLAPQTLATTQHGQQPFRLNPESFAASSSSDELLSLHRHLIEIESITGNENEVGRYLVEYFSGRNFTVQRQEVGDTTTANHESRSQNPDSQPRANILAYRGKSRHSRVLISSHIDTVPPFLPYKFTHGDQIWGRGSVDAKGAAASQIIAVEQLLASGDISDGDVALLFVVGEETGGDGMRKVNELGLKWETVIFGEPTELKLASGHKGNLGFTVTAKGKAAHSGYPWLGESAISMLIPALAALDSLQMPSSKKYGNTTINIGTIAGGVAQNVIAETAKASVAVRLAAGTSAEAREFITQTIFQINPKLVVEYTSEGYGPISIDHDVEGFDTIVCNYGTDIPNLDGDHKRYLYGPGSILTAHSDHEHLSVGELEEAVVGYKKLILAALEN